MEELRQYQAHVDANPAIPLYDLDGNVIGTFIRGTTQDNSTPDPDIVQKLNEMTGRQGRRVSAQCRTHPCQA